MSLVDTIFGVILAEGFVIYQANITNPFLSLQTDFALVVAYATIISSWIGYHRSVSLYPYNPNSWGRIHLSLDIFILVLYAFLIFAAQTVSTFLLGLFLVFFFYTVTGIIRIVECKDRTVSKYKLNAGFALAFLLEWYASLSAQKSLISWFLLVFAFILVIAYRWIHQKLSSDTKNPKTHLLLGSKT